MRAAAPAGPRPAAGWSDALSSTKARRRSVGSAADMGSAASRRWREPRERETTICGGEGGREQRGEGRGRRVRTGVRHGKVQRRQPRGPAAENLRAVSRPARGLAVGPGGGARERAVGVCGPGHSHARCVELRAQKRGGSVCRAPVQADSSACDGEAMG